MTPLNADFSSFRLLAALTACRTPHGKERPFVCGVHVGSRSVCNSFELHRGHACANRGIDVRGVRFQPESCASEGLDMTQRANHSSSASMSAAPTRWMSDSHEGKPCTTLARRLILRWALSWTLLVRILVRCVAGNARCASADSSASSRTFTAPFSSMLAKAT